MPVIPELRSQRQVQGYLWFDSEFETSSSYMRPCVCIMVCACSGSLVPRRTGEWDPVMINPHPGTCWVFGPGQCLLSLSGRKVLEEAPDLVLPPLLSTLLFIFFSVIHLPCLSQDQ